MVKQIQDREWKCNRDERSGACKKDNLERDQVISLKIICTVLWKKEPESLRQWKVMRSVVKQVRQRSFREETENTLVSFIGYAPQENPQVVGVRCGQ